MKWSTDETIMLINAINIGMTYKEISTKINKSQNSCRCRAQRLGLTKDGGKPLTTSEVKLIVEHYPKTMTRRWVVCGIEFKSLSKAAKVFNKSKPVIRHWCKTKMPGCDYIPQKMTIPALQCIVNRSESVLLKNYRRYKDVYTT